jgi:hypothetical protein
MSERQPAIESVLGQVSSTRRGFLKKALIGGAVAALVAPASAVLHAQELPAEGKGKGDE